MPSSTRELRHRLRSRRRALTPAQKAACAKSVARRVIASRPFLRSRRIGCYWSVDGELDTRLLLRRCARMHKSIYLPVLSRHRKKKLWFVPYQAGQRCRVNRYGIMEPRYHPRQACRARQLDLLLMPLVGFDSDGNRLGMGGGYYDSSLAFMRLRKRWQRPFLLGLAYEIQRVAKLTTHPWDIRLHAVATERRFYISRSSA